MNFYKRLLRKQSFFLMVLLALAGFVACQQAQTETTSDTTTEAAPEEGWTSLFNGQDLSGWQQVNGSAPFTVRDGVIVGTTVHGSPNSFLASEQEWGDFVLEFEFKLPAETNSGVQFRSRHDPAIREGRVHGYQFEMDHSERQWTGGIYDEQRRGWLYPLSLNPDAQQAFRKDDWNKAHIEVIGKRVKTWLNGVPVAHLADTLTTQGYIALQVHSIGDNEEAGKEIMWRNIRIKTTELSPAQEHSAFVVNLAPNTLTEEEKERGWRLLWDGQSSQGWRGAHQERFPEQGWQIRDGVLWVMESGGGESVNGGDIVTEQEFSAFDLQLQFKLTEGANSGIKYFVTEKEKVKGASAIGLEYQLLDDEKHPDARMGREGNRTLASLYDLKTAQKQERFLRPIGQWNTARLVVHPDNRVEHWLNGIKVLEYERGSQEFKDLVAISKYKDWENFGTAKKGRILLQDHGNTVAFRSIKIRELN